MRENDFGEGMREGLLERKTLDRKNNYRGRK